MHDFDRLARGCIEDSLLMSPSQVFNLANASLIRSLISHCDDKYCGFGLTFHQKKNDSGLSTTSIQKIQLTPDHFPVSLFAPVSEFLRLEAGTIYINESMTI